MISFWSVLSATLWFVLAFLLLSLLRGHVDFLMRHGVAAWSIAVVLTIVRLLLPLDSERMFVIRSYKLLPTVRRALDCQPVAGVSVSLLLKGLWLAGALCGIGLAVYKFLRVLWRFENAPALPLTPEIRAAAQKYGVSPSMICVTTAASSPLSRGLLHPAIYLPIRQYDEITWGGIVKHEMCHIKGHDTWLKMGFTLFRCVFWWNPLVHAAKKSVDDILELRCDRVTLNGMSKEERIAYIEAMQQEAAQEHKGHRSLVGASNFVSPERANTLVLRAEIALNEPPRWDKTAIVAFVLSLVLFVVSYVFILQPAGMPPTEDMVPVNVVSSGTTYLKLAPTGEYEMWIDGELVGMIPADALDDGLFQNLEVLP